MAEPNELGLSDISSVRRQQWGDLHNCRRSVWDGFTHLHGLVGTKLTISMGGEVRLKLRSPCIALHHNA